MQQTFSHDSPGTEPAQFGSSANVTRGAKLYLVLTALWLVLLGWINLSHPNDWSMGDWLINYSGGFVRRGLIGQGALLLRGLHIAPTWSVLILQWILYATVLATLWQLLDGLVWTWWLIALFFSPATVAFVLLDPSFAYRKEILFFALMASSILWLTSDERKGKPRADWLFSLLLTLGCAVCVLAHEGLFVFFPYLASAVLLGTGNWRRAGGIMAAPLLVSLALFLFVSRFPGDVRVAASVCQSIGGHLTVPPSGICGGAIDYLKHDSTYAHNEVRRVILMQHPWKLVPWMFVLPFLPQALGVSRYRRTDPAAARVLLITAACSGLLSTSLFYYGTDWTRWIYIHAFSTMLLLLFVEAIHRRPTPSENQQTQRPPLVRWPAMALLALYCLGWELSVYGQRPLYGTFFRYVLNTLHQARG